MAATRKFNRTPLIVLGVVLVLFVGAVVMLKNYSDQVAARGYSSPTPSPLKCSKDQEACRLYCRCNDGWNNVGFPPDYNTMDTRRFLSVPEYCAYNSVGPNDPEMAGCRSMCRGHGGIRGEDSSEGVQKLGTVGRFCRPLTRSEKRG